MSGAHVTTAAGVRIAWQDAGAPDGPPIVLLHALGERGSDWNPVVPLLGRRYRLLMLDLRGHGDSDRADDYSTTAMAGDVEGVLDAWRLGPVVVLGHSLGGVVAYRLATRRPDLVGRLVVEDVLPPRPRPPRPALRRPQEDLPFDWAVVTAVRAEQDAGDVALWEALSSITAPILVVSGGPDGYVAPEGVAEMTARIPHVDVITIPAGHLVHHERPAEFADAVLAWLAAH